MKNTSAVLRALALTILVMVALCALAEYGVRDYKERAKEQTLLEEARRLKSHPLVLNGCETDAECERLDEMLEVIHTSYTLD